ncbi:MAG TPA: hypothetical protein VMY77_10145 [Chitinophagaceae bacterium]|nr:hypothetical protein [Chitinophagaceae bacterium]
MRQIIISLFLIGFTSCNEMTQPKPVVVEAPESKPSIDAVDSSFLKIKIGGDNYSISFFNETYPTKNINELETFLKKNIDRINKNKVLVTGLGNSEKKQSLLDLFSRYGISKFHANSN